jgi:hypothetical protein
MTMILTLIGDMKEDSKTLTYPDLKKSWPTNVLFPFKQLENNKDLSDRFPTSWSVQRGHHFYVWTKRFQTTCLYDSIGHLKSSLGDTIDLYTPSGSPSLSASSPGVVYKVENHSKARGNNESTFLPGSRGTDQNGGQNGAKVPNRCFPISFSSLLNFFGNSDTRDNRGKGSEPIKYSKASGAKSDGSNVIAIVKDNRNVGTTSGNSISSDSGNRKNPKMYSLSKRSSEDVSQTLTIYLTFAISLEI